MCEWIFLILLVMKLTGRVDYSWWVVTLPLWFIWIIPSICCSLSSTGVGVATMRGGAGGGGGQPVEQKGEHNRSHERSG